MTIDSLDVLLFLFGTSLLFHVIYLGPNYGGGNEDNGNFLQRSHACTATLSAPNPAADHHQRMPPPETPGYPQASLLWGHCFLLLGPGAQGSVVPSKSLFPSPM